MADRALSEDTLRATIQKIEDCLKRGYAPPWVNGIHAGGAISEAARRAASEGWVRTERTFTKRYETAKARGLIPDWSIWRSPVYQRPACGEHFTPVIISHAQKPTGKAVKVCAIGDTHDDPRLPDKSRFTWLGRWASECEADYVVQIGDWSTFDSVSSHAAKGSVQERENPFYRRDIDSLGQSHAAFRKGLSGAPSKLVFTEGNHELRVARFENSNPNMAGTLVPQWRNIFQEHGWRIHEFGEYCFIEGVGFIHHPINGAGKAYGGKTGNTRVGNEALFSIIHGHDHRRDLASAPKIGPTHAIDVLSIGCALPWGHVEDYAKHNPTGWWWGAMEFTIQDGVITDMDAVSMLSLEARYSDSNKSTRVKVAA